MVDVKALMARMVLAGYNQKTLTEACKRKGYNIGKNYINSLMNGRSPWTIDDADMFIDVLEIHNDNDKIKIFLP